MYAIRSYYESRRGQGDAHVDVLARSEVGERGGSREVGRAVARQTGAMDMKSALAITASLLRDAVADYAAAVTDYEVVDLQRYQSGRGLVTEAEALVRYRNNFV